MVLFLFALGSLVLLIPLIYILPLGFTTKGIHVIVITSTSVAMLSLLAKITFDWWQSMLLLILLVVLSVYVIHHRFSSLIYEAHKTDTIGDLSFNSHVTEQQLIKDSQEINELAKEIAAVDEIVDESLHLDREQFASEQAEKIPLDDEPEDLAFIYDRDEEITALIDDLDKIDAINDVDAFDGIDKIDAINDVDALDGIDKINAIYDIDAINSIDEIGTIDVIDKMDEMSIVDQTDTIDPVDEVKIAELADEVELYEQQPESSTIESDYLAEIEKMLNDDHEDDLEVIEPMTQSVAKTAVGLDDDDTITPFDYDDHPTNFYTMTDEVDNEDEQITKESKLK